MERETIECKELEKVDFITLIPTICDSCGRKVLGYYSKNGEWWDKYVDNGIKVCLDCIKDKRGFAEDFERNIKISLSEYEKLRCK